MFYQVDMVVLCSPCWNLVLMKYTLVWIRRMARHWCMTLSYLLFCVMSIVVVILQFSIEKSFCRDLAKAFSYVS